MNKINTKSMTFLMAFFLCVICSLLVSSSAILLKDRQVENKTLDMQKNLLHASGLLLKTLSDKEIIEKIYGTLTEVKVKDFQVYYLKEQGAIKLVILPIEGKGLWSMLYGFIALRGDTRTIEGIGFYEHGETPGLGGEIDNPAWKASWKGKIALGENFQPIIKVVKGRGKNNNEIDGLSGATITSRGVSLLVRHWLGPQGFGPFLSQIRDGKVGVQ